jgi:tRNA-dihydrouridine synthase 1
LRAAKNIENYCDAVDINLGCPQRIARRGYYGSFLMDNLPLVYELVRTLHQNLKVPVFCKIRVFPEYEKTLEYAKGLEKAGCQLLVVHGRTREAKGIYQGLANLEIVKKLKKELSIPVVSNGNIQYFEDVAKCIEETNVDGVMSAEALLRNPALFSGKKVDAFQLAFEYLDLCEQYETPLQWIKDHLCKILLDYVMEDLESKDKLIFLSRTLPQLRENIQEFQRICKENGGARRVPFPQRVKNNIDLDETIADSFNLFS